MCEGKVPYPQPGLIVVTRPQVATLFRRRRKELIALPSTVGCGWWGHTLLLGCYGRGHTLLFGGPANTMWRKLLYSGFNTPKAVTYHDL